MSLRNFTPPPHPQKPSTTLSQNKEQVAVEKDSSPTQGSNPQINSTQQEAPSSELSSTTVKQPEATPATSQPAQSSGMEMWSKFFSENGFSGDILNNLGTIIATLPETIGTIFSGKKKVELGNSILPAAMILMGAFTDSPILKVVLITVGAAAFLNKHTPGLDEKREAKQYKYKKYEDEPLNPRITNVKVAKTRMLMDIDGCTMCATLPVGAAAAYEEGSLPLNKLANAVLEQYDRTAFANQNIQEEQEERMRIPLGLR